MLRNILAIFVFVVGAKLAAQPAGTVLHRDDFAGDLSQWVVEQQPGGMVRIRDGALEIDDAAGCTVWFRAKLTAPVSITYEVTFVTAGGPNDRLSDLNCFWMASDPRSPADLFAAGHGRNGLFATYDSLRTYYVGQGGNTNTTTRFRRYDGTGARPLLPEHERTGAEDLLAPGTTYQIRLEARPDGTVRYSANGRLLFEWVDPQPLKEGWFGFRTVRSHQRIRHFQVFQVGP
jgi:Domain of unknown function (DUF6250)